MSAPMDLIGFSLCIGITTLFILSIVMIFNLNRYKDEVTNGNKTIRNKNKR